MSRKNDKKLVLNTETLRNLQDSQLKQVVGGVGPVAGEQQPTAGGGELAPCAIEAFVDPER
jgi:hypothetical protein